MKISVDFDGVLIDNEGIPREHEVGLGYPHKNAVEAIRFLKGLGHNCVVFTARTEEEWPKIKEWLNKYGFEEMEITNIKTPFSVYIDDRAVRFTDWQDICKLFG